MILKDLNMNKWNSIFFFNLYSDSNYDKLLNFCSLLFNNEENDEINYIFSDLFKYVNNLFKNPIENLYQKNNYLNDDYDEDEYEDDDDDDDFEDNKEIEYEEMLSDVDKYEEFYNKDLSLIKSLNVKGESLFLHFHILFKHIFMEIVKINSMIEENANLDDYSDINEKLLVKAISLKNYLIVMLAEMLKL